MQFHIARKSLYQTIYTIKQNSVYYIIVYFKWLMTTFLLEQTFYLFGYLMYNPVSEVIQNIIRTNYYSR